MGHPLRLFGNCSYDSEYFDVTIMKFIIHARTQVHCISNDKHVEYSIFLMI